jgi:hypothetical protein
LEISLRAFKAEQRIQSLVSWSESRICGIALSITLTNSAGIKIKIKMWAD